MSYPIIILGAGASFDYIHGDEEINSDYKPPLTDSLFGHFLSKKYLKINYIADVLVSVVSSEIRGGKTLEQSLSKQGEMASKSLNKLRQFGGLQFYLQDLFREISNKYSQGNNNYRNLFDKIDNAESKEVCFVNFNYDSLLEKELPYNIKTINSLIKHPIKVIKIHGAYDWGYSFKELPLERFKGTDDVRRLILSNPQGIKPLKNGKIHLLNKDNKGNDLDLEEDMPYNYFEEEKHELTGEAIGACYSPAIAVPIPDKDFWVCPDEHIEELRKALQETDRILIIGWSAGDPTLIDIIRTELKKRNTDIEIKIAIVSSRIEKAEEVKEKIGGIKNVLFFTSGAAGFSNFMDSGQCEQFFSDKGLRF